MRAIDIVIPLVVSSTLPRAEALAEGLPIRGHHTFPPDPRLSSAIKLDSAHEQYCPVDFADQEVDKHQCPGSLRHRANMLVVLGKASDCHRSRAIEGGKHP